MAMVRVFQGRSINCTIRVGDQVAILYQSTQKGKPGETALVPLTQYVAERKFIHTPKGRQRDQAVLTREGCLVPCDDCLSQNTVFAQSAGS